MGRGRAKAKQTKVARQLKYQTLDTDLAALQRELRGESGEDVAASDADNDNDYADPYAEAYGEALDEDADFDEVSDGRR